MVCVLISPPQKSKACLWATCPSVRTCPKTYFELVRLVPSMVKQAMKIANHALPIWQGPDEICLANREILVPDYVSVMAFVKPWLICPHFLQETWMIGAGDTVWCSIATLHWPFSLTPSRLHDCTCIQFWFLCFVFGFMDWPLVVVDRAGGTFTAFYNIAKSHGLRGLWRGWLPNVQRAALVNMGGECCCLHHSPTLMYKCKAQVHSPTLQT